MVALRITVLGGISAQRDALVTAMRLHMATTTMAHQVTTQVGGDVTLLLGLSKPDSLPDSASHAADQLIRRQLNDARLPYQVLYGVLSEQLAQAVRILHSHQRANTSDSVPDTSNSTKASSWYWACEKCSDPTCEHKLLTDLLAQRNPAV